MQSYPVYHYVEERPLVEFTADEQAIQADVNRRVVAGQSLAEIMDFLFERTLPVCPCDRVGLAFTDEDGERIVARWCRATYEPLLLKQGYAEELAGSSLQQVIEEGHCRIINDLEAYLAAHPDSRSSRILVKEGVRSSMTCPLTVEGRRVGLFFRSSRQPNTYTPREVAMFLGIAERLGQAVEKAWRIERLEEANRSYMEMLGFASHELKSPLAAIISSGKLLTEGYLGEVEPKQLDRVQRMVRQSEYLLGLTREYLDLARLEGGTLEPHFRGDLDPVADLLDPALEIVQDAIEEHHVDVQVEKPADPRPFTADPDLLRIVMVNLLGNGVKYGIENGWLRISVTQSDAGLTVAVRNAGPGFPDEQKARLFRKFSRLQTPELRQRKGTGVGLYTCWRIVKMHGGRIWATSEQGEWAEFSFHIPPEPTAAAAKETI